jgi:hypothetical protein
MERVCSFARDLITGGSPLDSCSVRKWEHLKKACPGKVKNQFDLQFCMC